MLSEKGQVVVKEHIRDVLSCIDLMAQAIQRRKDTPEYDAQRQRPGCKNESPLTLEEQQMRKREGKLHRDIKPGMALCARWDANVGWAAFSEAEQNLVWKYWNGDLQRGLQELAHQPRDKGSRSKGCTPSW